MNNQSQFFSTREEISKWLDKHKVGHGHYKINDDLSVDVIGSADISNRRLVTIPINFRIVTGSFNCSDNSLTSLTGSPKFSHDFICNRNQLTNFIGGPTKIDGNFWACKNKFNSFDGIEKCIYDKFFVNIDKNIFTDKTISLDLENYYSVWLECFVFDKHNLDKILQKEALEKNLLKSTISKKNIKNHL